MCKLVRHGANTTGEEATPQRVIEYIQGAHLYSRLVNAPGRDRLCRHTADVAVVGSGLVGSVVARMLAEAGAGVLLLDGGSPMSDPPGVHLRNVPECRADEAYYAALQRAHLRPVSMPAAREPLRPGVPTMPERGGLNRGQGRKGNLPAARSTALFGGMGVLWSCVAPRLDRDLEPWPGVSASEWEALYVRAEEALSVGLDAGAGSARQAVMLRALDGARPAPVAARRDADGVLRWTGPAEVLGGLGLHARELVRVLAQRPARGLRVASGRVVAVDLVNTTTGAEERVEADAFVVAAGPLRTPALLWASGILRDDGDASPLGRHLYEHRVAYGQVVLDPELTGDLDAGDPEPFVSVPLAPERPYHGLLLCEAFDPLVLEGRLDERYLASLYWYVRGEPRPDSRITFDCRLTDALGLPLPTFEHQPADGERERAGAALDDLRAAGEKLGGFLPSSPPQIRSPGSSMHLMATTRAGMLDDGTSAADMHGRVWGFENLFLAGTGLVPGATASNPTLAACAFALRTADRMRAGCG
jgi:choline dehydrogenase-like flavoprotein